MEPPDPQLPLFAPGRGERAAEPTLAPLSSDVLELAARMPADLRLGGMSWTYAGWIGRLYAIGTRKRDLVQSGLRAYSKHPLLRAVEFDRTYYKPISAATYAQYAAQVPEDFRCEAKAHKSCTQVHDAGRLRNPLLLDASYATNEVIAPFVDGLGSKAEPLVFQFSRMPFRSPERFAERLHDFLRQLPRGPLYAVELRNAELLTSTYGAALEDTGAVHSHNDWNSMPGVLEQRALLPAATRRVLVVRWLSRPGDSYGAASAKYAPYDRLQEEDLPRRRAIAQLVADTSTEGASAFVMVSNRAEGCAPETVVRLARECVRNKT